MGLTQPDWEESIYIYIHNDGKVKPKGLGRGLIGMCTDDVAYGRRGENYLGDIFPFIDFSLLLLTIFLA